MAGKCVRASAPGAVTAAGDGRRPARRLSFAPLQRSRLERGDRLRIRRRQRQAEHVGIAGVAHAVEVEIGLVGIRLRPAVVGGVGHAVAVRGSYVTPPPGPQPVPGTEFELPADLVLVAIGFSHPEHTGAVAELALELDRRGNVKAPTYATSAPSVFAAGDARIGQSLVVNAIAEGRRCARVVDRHLAAVPVS